MKNSLQLFKTCILAIIISMSLSTEVTAQRIDSLYVTDTRSIPSMPGNYSRSLKVNFKYNSIIGLSGIENYSTVIGLREWTADNSGGKAYELAFASDKIFLRSGYTSGWGSWKRILTDENIKELPNGNVGIGMAALQSKLAVNGTITATKVKVTQTGWPDFVFDSAYHLPLLSKTETFITANHHLPGIPSVKEIESNGLDIGNMEEKQMKKIEELTLYQINANKKINQLQNELKEYKNELSELKRKVEQLKIYSK